MSVTRRACRDRINRKTKIDVKTHTVELISVNADVQWRPSRKKKPTCHYKVMWHGLIDDNFMNICRPMRLGDFLESKDLQELNYSCTLTQWRTFEKSGSHHMIGLSS